MNRAREYTNFAGWFAGLGYVAMWPLTAEELSGKPFGASIFCRDNSLGLMDLLCNSAHPLRLPAALHVLGLASALFVTLRLVIYAFKRARRGRRAVVASVPAERMPHVAPQRYKPPSCRHVTPRSQFGLRGRHN